MRKTTTPVIPVKNTTGTLCMKLKTTLSFYVALSKSLKKSLPGFKALTSGILVYILGSALEIRPPAQASAPLASSQVQKSKMTVKSQGQNKKPLRSGEKNVPKALSIHGHPVGPSSVSSMSLPFQKATVRLKDIVTVEGVRDNQLVGYGLVVGLNGTGDDPTSSPYTLESLVSMLERLGINIRDKSAALKTKNVAAVMVTSTLPPFARHGNRIDVTVSALGNATSLLGGTLVVTPLLGADNEVYAVAQGSVAVGGFSATGQSLTSVVKNVPTSGRVANGAIIEREVGFEFKDLKSLRLTLRNPDFTTARRVSEVINAFTRAQTATPLDPTTITLSVPESSQGNLMPFITTLEQLKIAPDQVARVIIDEQNGVIVMGEHVKISAVAVAHGNLTIKVTETPQVSQPNPFSTTGTTEVVQRSKIEINQDEDKKMTVLSGNVSLQDLVNALNSLGVAPRDLITILRTIKASGALQADIEVM